MQSTTHGSSKGQGKTGQPQMMPITVSKTDDSSGLYDLKALASSTKQRRSQRLSSQMEAQDSLLQSAASLEAVALPAPNKQQAASLSAVAIGEAPAVTASVTASVAQEEATLNFSSVGTPPTSKSKYLLLAGVTVAVAAAAAFYVMRGGASDNGESPATAANALVAPAEEQEPETQPEVVPEVAPLVAAEEASDDTIPSAEDAIADTEGGVDDQGDEEATPEASVDVKELKSPAADNSSKSNVKLSKSERAAAKAEAKEKRALAKAAKAAAKAERRAAKAEKKAVKNSAKTENAPVLGEGGASLDDVLSSVTGGVNKPVVEKVDKTPSKKRLERGDVSKAMKSISKAAKGCYSSEEFSGTVMVKYSVAPSGALTKAKALGAHKSSKTGKCVVKAVKRAKFPAFSGATQSFTFPFLLSP